MPLTVEIADEHELHAAGHARLGQAVRGVLAEAGIRQGEISVAIVNDGQMQALNWQFLQHDYPTDVLSFVLDRDPEVGSLDGEIIVSADYAAREAERYGWKADDELLLYVIHGCLHLVGHDDQTAEGQAKMRAAETDHLARFGLAHRYDPPGEPDASAKRR